jgi:hypothetical protein
MTMRYRPSVALLIACVSVVSFVPTPASAAHILITDEEAKLPPPKGGVAVDRRGVTRAPKILLVADGNPIHSPMHFQLKFVSFGGAKIDLDSIKVTYLKTPDVDLTSRILSFALATGVDIPDAELPVGDHMIRVDLKDSDGRSGSTSFVLKVTP